MNLECPYCDADLDDPDDCNETNETYEHQCSECRKYFIFGVDYIKVYDSSKADCLNGGEHDYKQIIGSPEEYFRGRKRCTQCEREIKEEK